jgi:poly(beta-D-mannuronate) lyase
MTMQVAYRQGYDLFKLEKDSVGFHDAVAFLLRCLQNPYNIGVLPPGEQDLTFTNDAQYFSWMEIWLAHFDEPAMENFAHVYRPIFNRGAGGYLTLYFKRPEGPQGVVAQDVGSIEDLQMMAAGSGARYPLLEKWRRSQ